jgi:hypothetical protein
MKNLIVIEKNDKSNNINLKKFNLLYSNCRKNLTDN